MSQHLAGRPVSRATYERYDCRCDDCTAKVHEHRRRANAARTRDHVIQRQIEPMFLRGASYTEVMAITGESYEKIKRLRDRSA